ncbi:MAG: hypothetical protein UR95_C0005G0079 [Parcubacteria group bacterium GW2011_GWC1_36_108]|nr:MAG: hypothetical protein UR95_C0005G0079 [Parcubacteria group bacterium GW2011_GWC1_36_108]
MKITDSSQRRAFIWVASITGLILMMPLIAMQFTNEVVWTVSDFVVAGILLFSAGSIFVLASKKFSKHKLIVGVVVLIVLIWLWAELAVGIFTNWGS